MVGVLVLNANAQQDWRRGHHTIDLDVWRLTARPLLLIGTRADFLFVFRTRWSLVAKDK